MSIISKRLNVFMAVARHGSLSGASAELSLTLSPVSRMLTEFENHYSRKLFDRHGRGVRLTDDGIEFFRYLNPIYQELVEFEARMKPRKYAETILIKYDWSAEPVITKLQMHFLDNTRPLNVTFTRVTRSDYLLSENSVYLVSEIPAGGASLQTHGVIADELVMVSSEPGKTIDKIIISHEQEGNQSVRRQLSLLKRQDPAIRTCTVINNEIMREMVLSGVGTGILPAKFAGLSSWKDTTFHRIPGEDYVPFHTFLCHSLSERSMLKVEGIMKFLRQAGCHFHEQVR